MPTPTIPDGELFMNATLYTAVSGTQTITNGAPGQSFQPDFVWTKSRSNAQNNYLVDSVRGGDSLLRSNTTGAESILSSPPWVTFNSNGFSSSSDSMLSTGFTYVSWQWKAGGAAVTNTAGSITSQVSANTTSGFSIVKWTSNNTGAPATVGHGLGVAPSMVITKSTSNASGWEVYHASLGATKFLQLNSTSGEQTSSGRWNNTAPTSSVFTVGTDINFSTYQLVAYCWTPIAGYSAFGSYTGNGSTDGPFVYTGFRPKFVMFKRSDSSGSWFMEDSSRGTYNVMGPELYANGTDAEANVNRLDFLSNGFKMRAANAGDNASGGTYVYACWAENPFKYANAR